MAEIKSPFVCDVCGRAKGEVNHWWLANTEDGVRWLLQPWDDSLAATSNGIQHLCGHDCASKKQSEYMSKIQEERK